MSYPSLNPANASSSEGLLGLHKKLYESTRQPRKPVVGSWLMLPGANLARMLAQMGFDVRSILLLLWAYVNIFMELWM